MLASSSLVWRLDDGIESKERTTFRWAVLAAAGVVIAGLFWDAAWHSRQAGFESGTDMLRAHVVRYLGAGLAMAAALVALARRDDRKGAFVAALVAGTAAALGHALDGYAHWTGSESVPGHTLITLGEIGVVVSAVVLSPVSLRLPGARR